MWIKRGKNRFNKNDAPKLNMFVNVSNNKIDGGLATSRSTYMSIEPNKTYTISKIAGKAFRVATTSSEPKKDTSIISTVANHEGTSITITTESNAKYLFINYYSSANGDTESEEVLRSSLQVVEGSEALSFEEYVDTEINMKENGEFKEISSVAVGTVAPDRGEKLWIKRGKNRFNKATITKNMYLTSTGSTTTEEYWSISDYIEVKENKSYTYQGLTNVGSAPYSAFYDKNKKYVSSFKQNAGTNTITIPSGISYVRFSINKQHEEYNTFKIEEGTEATTYESYIETTLNVRENGFDEILNIDEINGNTKYSFGEQKVGTWIDGKPLYRKVLKLDALKNNGETKLYYDSTFVIQKFDIYVENPNSFKFHLPVPGTNYITTFISEQEHYISVQTSSDRTSFTNNYAIIEYTKTTD